WTLSNGATVYVKHSANRKNHIQMTGFRKGGYLALDTADYVSAVFAKDIIGASGAGKFSRQALTKYLTGSSASATLVMSQHREGLSASANMQDVETMFQLLYLKWTEPRVDERVFNNIKKKNVDAAKNRKLTPTSAYNKAISRAVGADDAADREMSAERITD